MLMIYFRLWREDMFPKRNVEPDDKLHTMQHRPPAADARQGARGVPVRRHRAGPARSNRAVVLQEAAGTKTGTAPEPAHCYPAQEHAGHHHQDYGKSGARSSIESCLILTVVTY